MAAPRQNPGLDDLKSFTQVLDFVANRTKYDERIANLEKKTQEADDAVRRVVALNALGALQARVKRDRLETDQILAAASQDAKKMRSAAQEKADKAAVETSEAKNALRLHTQVEAERLSKWEKELKGREEITDAKKRAAEEAGANAEALLKKGQKLKERYENFFAALKTITDAVLG